jgi:hypothetical protein
MCVNWKNRVPCLKGPWHEIFYLWFFSSKQLSLGPWYTGQILEKLFEKGCQWHRCECHSGVNDMWQQCQWYSCASHSGVNDTAVQQTLMNIFANDPKCCFLCKNLTQLHTTQRSQRCHWHCCDVHSSVTDTVMTCTVVTLTLLWHAQQYQWHSCANMTPPLWLWTSYSRGGGHL